MAKSIADQFLSLGLADKNQVKKDKAAKRKQNKQQRHQDDGQDAASRAAIEKARQEKVEKDRALNKAQQEKLQQKALLAQVSQIIQQTKIESPDADVRFNFADRQDNKVKAIFVTPAIQNDLAKGKLAIATSKDQFYVVTSQVAEKLMERSQSSVVFLAEATAEVPDEDDPYKDFVIPDDLMW